MAAAFGFMCLTALLGGISFGQIINLYAVTASSGLAGGAMGLVVALWRDRSFQSIALTILAVVFSIAGVEAFAIAFPTLSTAGIPLAEVLNPYPLFAVLQPPSAELTGTVVSSSLVYILIRLTAASLLVGLPADAPRLESRRNRAARAARGRRSRGRRNLDRG